MVGGSIELVKSKEPIGSVSATNGAVGLPAPEMEAAEMEGESE